MFLLSREPVCSYCCQSGNIYVGASEEQNSAEENLRMMLYVMNVFVDLSLPQTKHN